MKKETLVTNRICHKNKIVIACICLLLTLSILFSLIVNVNGNTQQVHATQNVHEGHYLNGQVFRLTHSENESLPLSTSNSFGEFSICEQFTSLNFRNISNIVPQGNIWLMRMPGHWTNFPRQSLIEHIALVDMTSHWGGTADINLNSGTGLGTVGDNSTRTVGEWTYFIEISQMMGGGSVYPLVMHVVATVEHPLSVPMPPSPTPPVGHTFAGWYFDAAFTQPFDGRPILADTVLHARFALINFTITYNLNGGSMTGQPTTFTINSPTITLPTPTRNGFTFMGWYTNPAFTGGVVTQIVQGSLDNRTFHARWLATQFSITYNLNGGVFTGNYPTNFTVESSLVILPSPTRNGFTFAGWYTTPNFSDVSVANIPTNSTGNRTFYARWIVIEFTITHLLNGGNMTGYRTTFNVMSDLITLPQPIRTGFIFRGWFTSADFSGTAVTNIPAGSTGNRRFYARWEVQMFRVTFMVNGVIFSEMYVPHGAVLANYSMLAINGGGAVNIYANAYNTVSADLNAPITGNIMFFATQPFGIFVDLTFNINGVTTTERLAFNTLLDNLREPVLDGFIFTGWYHDSLFTRPVLPTDRITSNLTIHARFVEESASGIAWWVWLAGGVGALLVIAIIVKAVKKKRR